MTATLETREAAAPSVWFFNPWIDTLALGGLSVLALLPFIALGITGHDADATLFKLALVGNVLVNYPHYAATYYRVYPRAGEAKKYPFEAIWAPILLVAVCGLGIVYQDSWLPWLALIYITYSGWHYSGQAFGVNMIFLGKSGLRLAGWQRQMLVLPIYLALFYNVFLINTAGREPLGMFGIQLPVLGVPLWATQTLFALVCLSLIGYVALNIHCHRHAQKRIPAAVHVILGAHLVWFAFSSQYPAFWLVVPFFHCLQYLVVTTWCDYREHQKEHQEISTAPLSAMAYLRTRRFGKYYGTQLVVGSALFLGIPLLLTGLGVGPFVLMSAVMTFYLNLHHFILDGAIWKLRRPEVSKALHMETPADKAVA